MSRTPTEEAVSQLRAAINHYRQLRKEIIAVKAAAEKLQTLMESANTVHREITLALENMDCKSDGNFGWESRIVWMLAELVNQAES